MTTNPKQSEGHDGALSALNLAIEGLNPAKKISTIAPAKAAFGSASVLLAMIRDSMANEPDYIELGLSCAEVCETLDQGLKGRQLDELDQPVLGAINQLTGTLAKIERKIVKVGKRSTVSRLLHAKNDKEAIAAWRKDLDRVLRVFDTKLGINTNVLVVDIHRNMADQRRANVQRSIQASIPLGESPPPPPWACFGRDKLIENVVGLADNLEPFALVGAGGIGKTSIALNVLHHDRIKGRFGDSRRFIRCDQFPPSRVHLLARLSKVIGAGVENPEDLAPLRPFLSSREMVLFFDNTESILDPQGTDAREMYAVVEELSRFSNICLGITSRISTVPPRCKRPIIPTLSTESACDIFYGIYNTGERSDIVSDLVRRLDFHALSITLLATTASQNVWSYERLVKEWDTHRARVLRTDYNESLAATIELSLASPTFRKLGADARELLGVVAFYPQGIDENNLNWLFPTIPDRNTIFDKFCLLSLTSRRNGVTAMLAPIRDYLGPRGPKSSPLLCATKERYFTRLSTHLDPHEPGFKEAEWIKSEDVNVEHLLNVFTSIDPDSSDVWSACAHFLKHLYWYKSRPVTLAPAIEGLPDDHHLKPLCLFHLSRLFHSIGNNVERKRLLTHVLELDKKRGNDHNVAQILKELSHANLRLNLYEEGIRGAKEALEIHKRLGNTVAQANCSIIVARLLLGGRQPDAAEEAGLSAIELLPEKGQEFLVCQAHSALGEIFRFGGEKVNAVHHFEVAIEIATTFNWHSELFWNHHPLADLFSDQEEFDNAQVHIERAKSHAGEGTYDLGRATGLQARIWYRQHRFEEATSEALRAIGIFEKLGAEEAIAECRELLGEIEQATKSPSTSDSGLNGTSPSVPATTPPSR